MVSLAKKKGEKQGDLFVFNCDCVFLTKFHTGETAVTFVTVDRSCRIFDQFVHLAWTAIDTFTTAITFFFINSDLPHAALSLPIGFGWVLL